MSSTYAGIKTEFFEKSRKRESLDDERRNAIFFNFLYMYSYQIFGAWRKPYKEFMRRTILPESDGFPGMVSRRIQIWSPSGRTACKNAHLKSSLHNSHPYCWATLRRSRTSSMHTIGAYNWRCVSKSESSWRFPLTTNLALNLTVSPFESRLSFRRIPPGKNFVAWGVLDPLPMCRCHQEIPFLPQWILAIVPVLMRLVPPLDGSSMVVIISGISKAV